MEVFVESGVGGHIDDAVQAWVFDQRYWGMCGQGTNETTALESLTNQLGTNSTEPLVVKERIYGDELAFDRDRAPAKPVERERTKAILSIARPQLINIIENCSQAQLDWDDPSRELPEWATWRTLRAMGWHVVDTELRYYLARLGFGKPRTSENLLDELRHSREHALRVVDELPADLVLQTGNEVWTTTKVLRRLAWHERSELIAIAALAANAAKRRPG